MPNVSLPENAGVVDTFTRTEGAQEVHMQAVVPVDPATGTPLDVATEATLAALKGVADTLLTAAQAIVAAAQSLDAKAIALNTSAIDGTVSVDNFPGTQPVSGPLTDTQLRAAAVPVSGPLTDTQLRATVVPVSAAALPLPSGAATEAGLDVLHGDLNTLYLGHGASLDEINTNLGNGADVPATADTGSWSLISLVKRLLAKTPLLGPAVSANSQPVVIASDQAPVPITGNIASDFWVSILQALERISNPVWMETSSGRLRVVLDALGGAQTLSTITTCSTLTSVSQVAGVPANSFIYDQMHAAWAAALRGRVT